MLGDSNPNLIDAYRIVRDHPEELIRILRSWSNSEDAYYEIRAQSFDGPITRAARFLYLMRLSFNGIYRENLKGEFNVPYGKKTHLKAVDSTAILESAILLSDVKLIHGDFEETLSNVQQSDFVFVDPPYTVKHNENGFVKYNSKIFDWTDQERLVSSLLRIVDLGATVVVSNADHETVRELYRDFEYRQVDRFSVISARSMHRGKVTEAVFVRKGMRVGNT